MATRVVFDPASLRRLRLEAGRTREDLATRSGVSYNSVASYEQGRNTPRADALGSLAAALDVTADQLLRKAAG